jgi:hypothetical protein
LTPDFRVHVSPSKRKDNLIIANSKIEEIAHTGAFYPYPDAGLASIISQILKSFYENFGLFNLIHTINAER